MAGDQTANASSHLTQMKRIKREMLEDGSHQAKLELRQSPISGHIAEKPGTHHGYQSAHYTANMAQTEPADKQNLTSNSFNKREEGDPWKANT